MSQLILFDALRNTRDLGGMTGADGRKIRPGKLIRSGLLFGAGEKDRRKLAGLVDAIADFRTDQECSEKPDPGIEGIRCFRFPILEERKAGVTRDEDSYEEVLKNMLTDAEIARRYMCGIYSGFVSSAHCRSQYERFVRLLLEDHPGAVLWHCTAGKDRAGFGTVIVQELLGVSRDDIMEDYLMTNVYLEPEIQELSKGIVQAGGPVSPEAEKALRYMFAAWREYLDTAYDSVRERYGGFDGFITEGLHITPAERERLRDIYLE